MSSKFSIESVRCSFNDTAKTAVDVRGWFRTAQGHAAAAVRIRLGSRLVDCQRETRIDLVTASETKDACVGFRAKFLTRPGLKWLHYEWLGDDGRWRVFARRLVRVPIISGISLQPKDPAPRGLSSPSQGDAKPPRRPAPAKAARISIVIPTYNRAENLERVVRTTQRLCGHFDFEWVIVDDGSTDSTPAVLESLAREFPHLRHKSVSNSGPGKARNLGAHLARNEVVLFMGDDILPTDEDFLRPHAEIHGENPTSGLAVLGKVVWPPSSLVSVSSVMRHIQGRGGEQFGYADFTPHSFYDWRFFYTCNVSLKRGAVADWLTEGFSDQFPVAAYEDAELAYRLSKRPGGFRVFYAPASSAFHLHPYTVAGFLRRQEQAGAMARVFASIYPEVLPVLGVAGVEEAARPVAGGPPCDLSADYLSVIEGLKAWSRILEHEGRLGNEVWHEDLLFAVFEMAYLQGYMAGAEDAATNFPAAYASILGRAKVRLARVLESEATGDTRFKAALLGLG